MKCWIGTEVEHNKNYGNKTVFIEGKVISATELLKVLKDNNLVDVSLYFGANETDLVYLEYSEDDLRSLKEKYTLIIETSTLTDLIDYSIFNNIIIRVDNRVFKLDPNNVSFKLRDTDNVYIENIKSDNGVTNLDDLDSQGLFKDDKIIYEE